MELSLLLAKQVVVMFLILGTGVLLVKVKILDEIATKYISNLILTIVVPVSFVSIMQSEENNSRLPGLMFSVLLAVVAHTVMLLLNKFVFMRGTGKNIGTERYAGLFSNAIFVGLPLARAAFGNEGLFYLIGYVAVFNIFIWTYGVHEIKKDAGKPGKMSLRSLLLNPGMMGVGIGFVLYIFNIRLAWPLKDAVDYIAPLNTPLALLLSGAYIATLPLKKIIASLRVFYISFIRLLALPLIMIFVFAAVLRVIELPDKEQIAMICLIAAACPVAMSGGLMAQKFGGDSGYISGLVAVTTVLSVFTTPIVAMIGQALL